MTEILVEKRKISIEKMLVEEERTEKTKRVRSLEESTLLPAKGVDGQFGLT